MIRIPLPPAGAEALGRTLAEISSVRRFMIDRDVGEMMNLAGGAFRRILSAECLRRIKHFGDGQARPILWLQGLPVAPEMPPTPHLGFGDDSAAVWGDLLLLGAYSVMGGVPVAYATENHGRLVRNVVPNPAAAGEKSSHGFDAELSWHTDNPQGDFEEAVVGPGVSEGWSPVPRFLGFSGWRNLDAGGQAVPTRILPVRPLLAGLPEEVVSALARPEYTWFPPASHRGAAPRVGVPVVRRVGMEWWVRHNSDPAQVRPLTPAADAALAAWRETLAGAKEGVIQVPLGPGEVLIFDNYRVTHSRSAFDPGTELGRARWMRRIYAVKSLASGRMVDAVRWPALWV